MTDKTKLAEALSPSFVVELPPNTKSVKYNVPMAMMPLSDWEKIEAALTPCEGDAEKGPSKPLLKRYKDEHGNEMVAVAAWFYDKMCEVVEAYADSPCEGEEMPKPVQYSDGSLSREYKEYPTPPSVLQTIIERLEGERKSEEGGGIGAIGMAIGHNAAIDRAIAIVKEVFKGENE